MKRSSGVDPFLSHLPDSPPDATGQKPERPLRGGWPFVPPSSDRLPEHWIPALVRLPSAAYSLAPDAEFREGTRLGNVVSGRGSKEALARIGGRDGVVVEVSREGGEWELDESVKTVGGNAVAAPDGGAREDQCVIGVIDGGIDPLHEAFLDADGRTRILYVWDQTAKEGRKPGELAQGQRLRNGARAEGTLATLDYGAVYTSTDIDEALTQVRPLPPMPAAEKSRTHGTHVASIAAGRRTLNTAVEQPFAGGMAPDARLVFVIPALRAEPGSRPSEGFAKSHIDALTFIDAVAGKLPVVVNLSAGIAAGAHDGSSTLEAGFDAFTKNGQAPGRAIVKSAGNARDAARYRRVNLAPEQRVRVKLAPLATGAQGPATIEAWFSSSHQIGLKLTEGQSLDSFTLLPDAEPGSLATAKGTAGLSYVRFHRDNGDSLLLLTLPPTTAGYTLEFHGIAVRGRGEIDLWVEGPLTIDTPTSDRTLTMPGTARTVITVASSDHAGQEIAVSSSQGPTRDGREKPEIFAPGLEIRAAKAGTRSETLVLSGTSMAAPHVTGAVALLFSKHVRLGREIPNALQVRAALIATARHMNGSWQNDRGFGLLDAEALVRAFD